MTYDLTPIMLELDWQEKQPPLPAPAMFELIPQGSNYMLPQRPVDPQFRRLLRFRLVIIWELTGTEAGDLGLGRGYEASESHDVYLVTMRAPTPELAQTYWLRLRDMLIDHVKLERRNGATNNECIYNRFEFQGITPSRIKSRQLYEFTLLAFRSGMVRRNS